LKKNVKYYLITNTVQHWGAKKKQGGGTPRPCGKLGEFWLNRPVASLRASDRGQTVGGQAHQFAGAEANVAEGFTVGNHEVLY
jgi:hypothetical protein